VTHEGRNFSVGTTVGDSLVDTLGEKGYPILEVMLDDFQDSRFVLQDRKLGGLVKFVGRVKETILSCSEIQYQIQCYFRQYASDVPLGL
jgi:hypothetical protein